MNSEISDLKGETVGVYLAKDLQKVFRAHVGFEKGTGGKFAVTAIKEKLEREGAFADDPTAEAFKALKQIDPSILPLLLRTAELVQARGREYVETQLEDLLVETASAAGGGK